MHALPAIGEGTAISLMEVAFREKRQGRFFCAFCQTMSTEVRLIMRFLHLVTPLRNNACTSEPF